MPHSADEVERVKVEMMFWFKQELRRRDAKIKTLQQTQALSLEENKAALESQNSDRIRVMMEEYESKLISERVTNTELQRNYVQVIQERDLMSRRLRDQSTAIQNNWDWIIAQEAMDDQSMLNDVITESQQKIKQAEVKSAETCCGGMIDAEVLQLKRDYSNQIEINQLTKQSLEAKIIEIKQLDELLTKEKEDKQKQISNLQNQLDNTTEQNNAKNTLLIEDERQRAQEAISERIKLKNDLVQMTIDLEKARHDSSDAIQAKNQLGERHQLELQAQAQSAQEQLHKASSELDMAVSELQLIRDEYNQLYRENQISHQRECDTRNKLSELKSRMESQSMQARLDHDAQTTLRRIQARRIQQFKGVLGKNGIHVFADELIPADNHEADGTKPNLNNMKNITTTKKNREGEITGSRIKKTPTKNSK